MALKLSKIVSFLQISANFSWKSKAVIAIYVYASKSSCFALLENGVGYCAMIKILVFEVDGFCQISAESVLFLIFYSLISRKVLISWTPIKKYYFLKEHDEVF